MNADELLRNPEWLKDVDLKDWEKLDENLRNAFLYKFGIHQDEYDNFNSNMPEILNLIKEHVKIHWEDKVAGELHRIYIDDCYFVKPYEKSYGLDDPEQALLRGNYECTVRATIVYTISCADEQEHELTKSLERAPVPEQKSDPDADEQEDTEVSEADLLAVDEEEKSAFAFDHNVLAKYTNITHRCVVDNHLLHDLPVLIKSMLCNMSSGMYVPSLFSKLYFKMPSYCVSRTFKLCPYEEYYINNRILAFKIDELQYRSKFYHPSKKFRTNCTLKMKLSASKFRPNLFWENAPRFLVEIPYEKPKQMLPVTVLAMAFGWTSEDFTQRVKFYVDDTDSRQLDMYLHILQSDKEKCETQKDAILRTARCFAKCREKSEDEADHLSFISFTLHEEFLSNLFEEKSSDSYAKENLRKGDALAQCAAELICLSPLINKRKPDVVLNDKRSYVSKRVDTPGEKLVCLARKYIKAFAKKASSKLKSTVENGKHIDLSTIFNRNNIKLTQSVKNGVWDSKTDASDSNQNKTQMMITGFCTDANHMQTQKIMKFAIKKNSNPETLLTHPTQSGRIDPYLTPESDKCGIVRFKTLGSCISQPINLFKMSRIILSQMGGFGWLPAVSHASPNQKLFSVYDVYGGLIGWVNDPRGMYKHFTQLRRRQAIHRYFGMEIDFVRKKFFFNCDEGRLMRPLIIGSEILRLISYLQKPHFRHLLDPVGYLITEGFIEYLDPAEEYCGMALVADCMQTAMTAQISYTHLEIHGCFSLAMGVSKAFANNNQGPRRMLTGNMEKRSMGLKLHPDRGTTDSHSLWYAQDNLVSEPADKALHSRLQEPNGMNANIMVLSSDYNIEDCWKINKASVELGFGISTKFHIFTTSLSTNCSFAKPDATCTGCASEEKYMHLDANGFPIVGSILRYGDAVVGKIIEYKELKDARKQSAVKKYRCMSKFIPWFSEYRVERVEMHPPVNPKTLRVSLVQVNIPIVGNKFYLQHGQKGTCGDITPKEDMPFVAAGPNKGLSPDVLVNVCSSMRVTLGLFLEMLVAKARAMRPSLVDQYNNIFIGQDSLREKLLILNMVFRESGLSYTGKDVVRCGKTGRLLECMIFWGPAKVGVLKHMARDKLRGRDRGPVVDLTRQPPAGHLLNGAQKFGEMENWCLHSWGSCSVFRNMNFHSAEKFMILVCARCDVPAIGCVATNFFFCKTCKQDDEILRVLVPYITNLTQQETYLAGWGHKLIVQRAPKGTPDELAVFHANQTA